MIQHQDLGTSHGVLKLFNEVNLIGQGLWWPWKNTVVVQRLQGTARHLPHNNQSNKTVKSMIKHSSDKALVLDKMEATFEHRQKLVHDPDKSVSILDIFPRFIDIPGLVSLQMRRIISNEGSCKDMPCHAKFAVMLMFVPTCLITLV